MPDRIRRISYFICFLGGYVGLHWASDIFIHTDFRVTPWNPETGLSFLFVTLTGWAAWPALFVSNLLGAYVSGSAGDLESGLLRSVLYATVYTGFGLLFREWTSLDRQGSLAQIYKLLVISTCSALIFGSLLVTVLSWLVEIPTESIRSAITTSATGDLIGILSIVPLYIALSTTSFPQLIQRSHLPHLVLGSLAIAVSSFVVFGLVSTDQFKFFYLVLLPVVALSILHGFVGAVLSIVASVLAMMIIIYSRDVTPGTATELQILMITLSATGLLLGSIVADRSRLASELVESHHRLSEAQARLLHASRIMVINEMATAIAHEINQPLSAIRNYCRTIQRLLPGKRIDQEKLGTLVKAAVEQVDAASDLINDTRRFVRRETSAPAHASIADSATLCFRLLHSEIVKGKVGVKVRIPPALRVEMQPVKLQQVLLNLVKNAIEAMEHRGRKELEIDAKRVAEGSVLITVKDSGCGIPETVRAELFTPFTTTKEHGLGLGLSLSKSIVEEHGGELWCDSSKPGETVVCLKVREVSTA